jgi:lysophospholipase L1-like esterase
MMRTNHKYKNLPLWVIFSLATNGLLILAIIALLLKDYIINTPSKNKPNYPNVMLLNKPPDSEKHKLGYQEWLVLLAKEADFAAKTRSPKLNILAGDSISLWFPPELLPPEQEWLNQGISGETTKGLLKRLNLFDKNLPKTIFIMIGINDLIRGVDDETILNNHRQILQYLHKIHPESNIVLQSILPHGGKKSNWEGRDRLLNVSNSRIFKLNEQLRKIAKEESAYFFDLYPLFLNNEGDLRMDLSTDGLHLNKQGYLVWSASLQVFIKLQLESKYNNYSGK